MKKSFFNQHSPAFRSTASRIPALALTIFSLFITLSLSAQISEIPPVEPIDSLEEKKDKDIEISIPGSFVKGRLKTSWLGLTLGINGFASGGALNLPSELDDFELRYSKSTEWTINLIKQRFDLYKKNVYLEYGPDIVFNIYRFENSTTLVPGQEEVTVVNESVRFSKNRLRITSLSFPVLFDFHTKKGKHGHKFRFGAGAYGNIVLAAMQGQNSKDAEKTRTRDDFNLNKFNYGLMARVGLGPITLFSKYGLTTFFKENEGPNLTPFTFGIVLIGDHQ